jgi:hypothetical protein
MPVVADDRRASGTVAVVVVAVVEVVEVVEPEKERLLRT